MSGPVDVLAVMSEATVVLDQDDRDDASGKLLIAIDAVTELIELGRKVAGHDYTFMPGTQWGDMQAFRAALARVGGAA